MKIRHLLFIFPLLQLSSCGQQASPADAAGAFEAEEVIVSAEAAGRSFWTEFDLTFWQTLPFATFWSYALAAQLDKSGAVNWSPVLSAALLLSLGNAAVHAWRVAK